MSNRGLPRRLAAEYIGCSPRMFDALVKEGVMPIPYLQKSKKVWDIRELDECFDNLPRAWADNDNVDANEWDAALNERAAS